MRQSCNAQHACARPGASLDFVQRVDSTVALTRGLEDEHNHYASHMKCEDSVKQYFDDVARGDVHAPFRKCMRVTQNLSKRSKIGFLCQFSAARKKLPVDHPLGFRIKTQWRPRVSIS